MLAEQFIDLVEQQGLLDKRIVNQLRRKVAKASSGGRTITAEQIAKLLVDAGHLTQFQATKLIQELTARSANKADDEKSGKAGAAAADGELGFRDSEDQGEAVEVPVAVEADAPRRPAFKAPPTPAPAAPSIPELDAIDDALAAPAAPLPDAGLPLETPAASSGRPSAAARFESEPTSVWDSRLVLIGGGTLGVMLIVGAFLYSALTRGAAEDLFGKAKAAYDEGSYAQSKKLFEQYISDYGRFKDAPEARVRVVLANMRQIYKNPSDGLKLAKEALPGVLETIRELPEQKQEELFQFMRRELTVMLPDMADIFIQLAITAEDADKKEDLLKKCSSTMELINNPEYITPSLKQSRITKLDEIKENMQRVERAIFSDRELKRTVDAIAKAVAAGDTQKAYAERRKLLADYPVLESDPRLQEAVMTITAKERELVKTAPASLKAAGEEREGTDVARVILAARRGDRVSGVGAHTVYCTARGMIYALAADTGTVRWTRYVAPGFAEHPQTLSKSANATGDALVIDPQHRELIRINADDGKLKWRLPLGQSSRQPVVLDQSAFLSLADGRLVRVDLESGNATTEVVTPVPAAVAPAVDRRRGKIYVVGDHDNVYVLDAESLACHEVFYLGHKPNSIHVPPIVALGYLFIAEQVSESVTLVHILATDQTGLKLKPAQSPFRLSGHVRVPMSVARRRVLVVTDRGEIRLLDIDLNTPEQPVLEAAGQPAHFLEPTVAYPFLDQGYLWVGETRLVKYQVQASTGKLPRIWVGMEGEHFVAPIERRGDVLYLIRRRKGMEGITVSALPMMGKAASWEVDLGGGASYLAQRDGTSLELMTPGGALFQIPEANLKGGTMVEPSVSVAIKDAAQTATRVDNRRVFSSHAGYRQILILDPAAKPPLRVLELNIAPGDATAPVTAFQNGILVPLRSGEVVLYDFVRGLPLADSFHPPVKSGAKVVWSHPAVTPDGKAFFISDSRRQLFRVTLSSRPRRNLREEKRTDTEAILQPVMAATGTHLYTVLRSGAADSIMVYQANSLEPAGELELEGRVRSGPIRVGDAVYVSTKDQLICCRDGKIAWTFDSPSGEAVGIPQSSGKELVLSFQNGRVMWLDAATGKAQREVIAAEPLASQPVVLSSGVAVIGRGGNLLLLPQPSPVSNE